MRDNIREPEYFIDLIQKEEENILCFESLVEKTLQQKGESDRGVRNGYNILISSYEKKINLLYSYGTELESVKKCFEQLLPYYSKMWNRKHGYIELIKVLSLAVLFEVDAMKLAELEEKLIFEKFDDYLVNILLKKVDSTWKCEGVEFEFKGIYDCLKPILEGRQELACNMLKVYLQEEWYELHRECAWYDSHKSEKSLYCGYWSFEAGAIAKILNLNDASLKGVHYYPYDLVHYAGQICVE